MHYSIINSMLCIYSLWFHFLTLVLKCWQQGENFICPSKLLNGGAWSLSEWRQGRGLQAKVETKGKQVCSDWAAEMAWAAWAARDTKNGCLFWWRTAGLGWAGQASLGTSRKYFHCLIPGHRIVIRRYRTLNAFTDKWIQGAKHWHC